MMKELALKIFGLDNLNRLHSLFRKDLLEEYRDDREPRFLFVLTHPYSGSTALVRLLNTSPYSMFLNRRAEGQWLNRQLSDKNRWDPDKQVDWEKIKEIWLQKYQQVNGLVDTIRVVIEKSPPNLIRAEQMLQHFPGAACCAFYRNPYANCSSAFHRLYSAAELSDRQREVAVSRLAHDWLMRSKHLQYLLNKFEIMSFPYEFFCEQTESVVSMVLKICPELGAVDYAAGIYVKDYQKQVVTDMNKKQIGKLTSHDVQTITRVLETEQEVLKLFGYTLM